MFYDDYESGSIWSFHRGEDIKGIMWKEDED